MTLHRGMKMSEWRFSQRQYGCLPPPNAGRAAFTLIELLVVIAIITVLVSIAMPNFLEAQMRCKVGRTLSNMRSIGTALEMYRQDWRRYPDAYLAGIDYLAELNLHELDPLTTPVAYIKYIPDDHFKVDVAPYMNRAPIDYYNSKSFSLIPQSGGVPEWILTSYGPNRKLDYISRNIIVYSPTNGTRSGGDLMLSSFGWQLK